MHGTALVAGFTGQGSSHVELPWPLLQKVSLLRRQGCPVAFSEEIPPSNPLSNKVP